MPVSISFRRKAIQLPPAYLDKIGVPGIARHSEVIIALILFSVRSPFVIVSEVLYFSSWAAEDMP